VSKRTEKTLPASSAQSEGTPRGNAPSKSWRLARSLAAQAHALAVVAPPTPAAKFLDVASGVDTSLSKFTNVLNRGAHTGALAVAYGDATQL